MDKKDVSIIEIIEKMVGEGESDDRIVKTLKDLGVPEEKAEKLLRIAQADTFSLLRREVKKIVEQQLEQEKPVLKKFIEDEAMSAATQTRQQVTKAVISDLKEYEQDITGQSRTFQEQIKENVSRVNDLSERVKLKLNELGEAVKAIQTGKVGPLSQDDIRQLHSITNQMGMLNDTVRQIQSTKAETKQLQPLTEELRQLQDVKNRMNVIAESLKQMQSRPATAAGADVGGQLQEMRARMQELAGAVRQAQGAKGQVSTADMKQLQEMRSHMSELAEELKKAQARPQTSPEDSRQLRELREQLGQLSGVVKQVEPYKDQSKILMEMRARIFELNEKIKLLQSRQAGKAFEPSAGGHVSPLGSRNKLIADVLWAAGLLFGLANLYFLYSVFGKPLSADSLIVMTVMALLTITLLFVATEMQPEAETTLANLKPISAVRR